MLTRHHPKYWNTKPTQVQTFLDPKFSVNDVKNIALEVAKQNNKIFSSKGTIGLFQVEGKVDGVKYVLGINKGNIRQLYPKE
ncbi:hypothetical protein [Metabacillus fastidiosus]|uniref:hypothetical protein n=1 Tax=Metabacillus fastidiosus TaxID=1458 RepID=UPI003D29F685